jgi:hypothetical protein
MAPRLQGFAVAHQQQVDIGEAIDVTSTAVYVQLAFLEGLLPAFLLAVLPFSTCRNPSSF